MILLSDILHTSAILPGMTSKTKHAAIEELVDLVVASGQAAPDLREHLLEVVLQREKSMSTGMEHGIALPHGSTERVDDIVGALGVASNGIPFDSLDGKPAQLVLLLVLPKQKFQAHVRTLACIARLFRDGGFREGILAKSDPEAVMEFIKTQERTATPAAEQ